MFDPTWGVSEVIEPAPIQRYSQERSHTFQKEKVQAHAGGAVDPVNGFEGISTHTSLQLWRGKSCTATTCDCEAGFNSLMLSTLANTLSFLCCHALLEWTYAWLFGLP